MSQIHHEELCLEDIVGSAEHILVVRADDPAFEEVSIPISDASYDGQEVPNFGYRKSKFIVEKVLRGAKNLTGEKIEILPADLSWERSLHYDYYVVGISKSPIFLTYYPKGDIEVDTKIIFICNHYNDEGDTDGQYQFVNQGAMEGMESMAEVVELMKTAGSDLLHSDEPAPASLWQRITNKFS